MQPKRRWSAPNAANEISKFISEAFNSGGERRVAESTTLKVMGRYADLGAEEAAKAVDVATKTPLRWMKEPEFQKAYREARGANLWVYRRPLGENSFGSAGEVPIPAS